MDNKREKYAIWIEDAIGALGDIPENARSEEVGEVLETVIDDLLGVLHWLQNKD